MKNLLIVVNPFLVLSTIIFSQISYNREFQVNSYTNSYQSAPSICSLTNMGFVICWSSDEQDGSGYGIYAQIYDKNGTKVGDEFQVNTFTNYHQMESSTCGLTNGGFVVCWESEVTQDGSGFGIYTQIFNENGIKVGNEFQVNNYTNSWQWHPSTCGLTNGGFVICWESYNQDGSKYGIYSQIYDENGTKVGNEFQVNTYSNGDQDYPRICGLTNGGFVICWESSEQDESKYGIYSQIYDENGTKVGNEFQVNTYTNSNQARPSTCSLTNGGFVICWESSEQDGSKDGIFGKYYLEFPIKHILTNYKVLEPKNDSSLINKNLDFIWNKPSNIHVNFPWELTYDLYIDKYENFTNPITISGIQDTTYQIDSLTPGNTYFWKVLARNYYGNSLWSSNVNGFYIDQNATDVEQTNQIIPSDFEVE
jgi:hypothetical protein